jgi:hypothetical protein
MSPYELGNTVIETMLVLRAQRLDKWLDSDSGFIEIHNFEATAHEVGLCQTLVYDEDRMLLAKRMLFGPRLNVNSITVEYACVVTLS